MVRLFSNFKGEMTFEKSSRNPLCINYCSPASSVGMPICSFPDIYSRYNFDNTNRPRFFPFHTRIDANSYTQFRNIANRTETGKPCWPDGIICYLRPLFGQSSFGQWWGRDNANFQSTYLRLLAAKILPGWKEISLYPHGWSV